MFQTLTDVSFAATFSGTQQGVVIFVKKLCPHCKNMLKMLEKFEKFMPGVPIFTLDVEDCPGAAHSLAVDRAPTIFVVKEGKPAARKTGLLNPKEMVELYESA